MVQEGQDVKNELIWQIIKVILASIDCPLLVGNIGIASIMRSFLAGALPEEKYALYILPQEVKMKAKLLF
ncbi:MAG TPA: hypothetical protein VIY47_09585 [Ignavibacteriaceae bacterium]